MSIKQITKDTFWESDLDCIENAYLKGRKVTDLPLRKRDGRVPNQGSVLMECVVNIDHVIPRKNHLISMIKWAFRKRI